MAGGVKLRYVEVPQMSPSQLALIREKLLIERAKSAGRYNTPETLVAEWRAELDSSATTAT
jgi:DNA-binding transcriptional regulator YiaG